MNITNRTLRFKVDGATHHAYMAWDSDVTRPAPGIMVIHEWWGLNDYIKRRADQLAELGYVGFAVDMYGGGATADNPDDAGKLMNAVLDDMETAGKRLRAAHAGMLERSEVDPKTSAIMGYCFGGAMALHAARIGMDIDAAVSFHGALGSFHKPAAGQVKAAVLVCHGKDDAMVSMKDVGAFKREMGRAKAEYEVIVHPGAGHGFSNPGADEKHEKFGLPVGYNADADRASWEAMQKLFASRL